MSLSNQVTDAVNSSRPDDCAPSYGQTSRVSSLRCFKYFGLTIVFILMVSCGTGRKVKNTRIKNFYSENIYNPIPGVDLSKYNSAQARPGQTKGTTLGISISGGGSRAQYFGSGVLIGLDDVKLEGKPYSLLREIDYYSTISGGGFAAGYYLSMLKTGLLDNKNYFDYWKSDVRKETFQEFLYMPAKPISVLKMRKYERNGLRMSYPDRIDYELLQYGKDNGKVVPSRLTLGDFYIDASEDSNKVKLPIIVANGTVYNNAERFAFMPHVVSSLGIVGSYLPEEDFPKEGIGYSFPFSYALSGSAAFPGILPMLKLKTQKYDNHSIRIIDGGAIDNLGYRTLFELLSQDRNHHSAKGAIIVDCGGLGREPQFSGLEKLGVVDLLPKMLLYSVDINLLDSEEGVNNLANSCNIDQQKVVKLGLHTLKSDFQRNFSTSLPNEQQKIRDMKKEIIEDKWRFNDLYHLLVTELAKIDPLEHISEIPEDKFNQFNLVHQFLLFELAAQVKTKIAIARREKDVLVLAGRYSVYLRKDQLKKLLNL